MLPASQLSHHTPTSAERSSGVICSSSGVTTFSQCASKAALLMWSMKQPAKPNIFGTAPARMTSHSPAAGAFQTSVSEARSR